MLKTTAITLDAFQRLCSSTARQKALPDAAEPYHVAFTNATLTKNSVTTTTASHSHQDVFEVTTDIQGLNHALICFRQ